MEHLVKALGLVVLSSVAYSAHSEEVKLTSSGICHTAKSPYFNKIRNFESHSSLESCLSVGGRAIKESAKKYVNSSSSNKSNKSTAYSRDLFPHWLDADGDCQNLRHELLISQSGNPASFTKRNECYVASGSWKDPYSSQVFHAARDVHIDHVVPLYFAFKHGADKWTLDKRTRFANDVDNLLVVSGVLNEEKGAKDITQWLPPNQSYQCKYMVKFVEIIDKYDIELSSFEIGRYSEVYSSKCAD